MLLDTRIRNYFHSDVDTDDARCIVVLKHSIRDC